MAELITKDKVIELIQNRLSTNEKCLHGAKEKKLFETQLYFQHLKFEDEQLLSLVNCLIPIKERKQGEWITNDIDGVCICPFCKHEIIGIEEDLNFCCKCGTKLSFPKAR